MSRLFANMFHLPGWACALFPITEATNMARAVKLGMGGLLMGGAGNKVDAWGNHLSFPGSAWEREVISPVPENARHRIGAVSGAQAVDLAILRFLTAITKRRLFVPLAFGE